MESQITERLFWFSKKYIQLYAQKKLRSWKVTYYYLTDEQIINIVVLSFRAHLFNSKVCLLLWIQNVKIYEFCLLKYHEFWSIRLHDIIRHVIFINIILICTVFIFLLSWYSFSAVSYETPAISVYRSLHNKRKL